MKPAALILATALHLLLLGPALVSCKVSEPPKQPKPPAGERTIDVRLLPSEQGESDVPACARTYRGIGITRGFLSMVVQSVAPGGPADRAGVKPGDTVLNDDDLGADRFMVGHKITLHVEREGRRLALPVVIGRICYED
jgi:S1-C subfamily serine protease